MIAGGCKGGGTTTCTTLADTRVYINNGTSLNEDFTWQQNLEKIFRGSLAFGDINNDGYLDLALCGNNGTVGIVKIYTNNGTSLVENSQFEDSFAGINPWGCSLAFGDINNDGRLDLAFVGADSTTENGVYINNGTSFIKSSSWIESLPLVGQTLGDGVLSFGDIDNDGYLDLIFAGSYSTDFYASVYTNNGTSLIENSIWKGEFYAQYPWPSIILGDYNNDNNLDLFVMGVGDNCRKFKNNETAFELNQTEENGLCSLFDGSFSLGDRDNDGDLDLSANGKEGYSGIYNNNQTYFSNELDESNNLEALQTGSSILWADLDNDLDLDLIEAGLNNSDYTLAKVYISNASLTTPNTLPNPPTSGFSPSYVNNVLTLNWGNGSDDETSTLGLYYNLMIGNETDNNSIVSGVYGGSSNPTAGYFGNMMQRKSIVLNLELESNKTYNWYVQTIDTGLAKGNWSEMQSFTTSLDVTKPELTIESPSPAADLHTTNAFFIFNATIADANLSNVTLYGDWDGSFSVNGTDSSGINGTYTFELNLTNYNDSEYLWEIEACDADSNCQSETRSFSLDREYPSVTSISPESTWTESNSVVFSFNVTDLDVANCSLILDNGLDQTNTTISENITQTFTKTLANGNYNWFVNCTDYVGYENSSDSRSLSVSYTAPSGGSSTGGGGGTITSKTYTISELQLISGYTQELAKDDKISFAINNENHSLIAKGVYADYANLTLSSELTNFIIYINETKKFELTNDNYYDLAVKLNSIENNKANLTITRINEKIATEEAKGNETTETGNLHQINKINYWKFIIIIALITILLLFLFMILNKLHKHRVWRKHTLLK